MKLNVVQAQTNEPTLNETLEWLKEKINIYGQETFHLGGRSTQSNDYGEEFWFHQYQASVQKYENGSYTLKINRCRYATKQIGSSCEQDEFVNISLYNPDFKTTELTSVEILNKPGSGDFINGQNCIYLSFLNNTNKKGTELMMPWGSEENLQYRILKALKRLIFLVKKKEAF